MLVPLDPRKVSVELARPEDIASVIPNREAWLNSLAVMLHPLFKGWRMAPYRLTCGWPCRGGLARRRRVVGECHALESSKAGIHEIFISPMLADPPDVAGTVAHEMAHVAAGIKAAHGRGFIKVCRHIGLTRGRPTSASPGLELTELITRMLERLGPYPHTAVTPVMKATKSRTTVSLHCPTCPCRVTMSLKQLESIGAPTCACGEKMTAVLGV